MPYAPRQFDVGGPGNVTILHRGVADGAEMVDHLERRPAVQKLADLVRGDQPRRRMLRQIPPLAFAAETVGNSRLLAASNQCSVQVGADEAGAARDQYHAARYRLADESAKAAKGLRP